MNILIKINLKKIQLNLNHMKKGINNLLDIIKSFGGIEEKKNSLGQLLNENDIELISKWIKSDNKEIKK